MIAAALLLAASPASSGPVVPYAAARSVAYRDCVAAERRRRTASVVQIGRGACAGPRSKLVARVHDYVSYGWAATAKTDGQARRLRAHLKEKAQAEVAGFESKLEAWLAGTEGEGGSR